MKFLSHPPKNFFGGGGEGRAKLDRNLESFIIYKYYDITILLVLFIN